MAYPEPYNFISWTTMSYLELLWALPNGMPARGMVLIIYRSFSLAYPLFASLKMSGMSITYPGYWYLPSPDKIPTTSKSKFSTVCPIIPEKVFPFKNSYIQKSYQLKSMGYLLIKNDEKRKEEKSPWKPSDMPGIPREVAEHSLNIRPSSRSVG